MANFAGLPNLFQGFETISPPQLLRGRVVELEEVEGLPPQPLQASLHRREQIVLAEIFARLPRLVSDVAGFGGDDDVSAFEDASQDFFAAAETVDVGGVEKIDSQIERPPDGSGRAFRPPDPSRRVSPPRRPDRRWPRPRNRFRRLGPSTGTS